MFKKKIQKFEELANPNKLEELAEDEDWYLIRTVTLVMWFMLVFGRVILVVWYILAINILVIKKKLNTYNYFGTVRHITSNENYYR